MILRRSDEALYQANLGLELDPLKPLVLGLYGVVMTNEGDYDSAILHFEKALSINPNFGFAAGNLLNARMEASYYNKNYDKWFKLWEGKTKKYGHWNDEGRAAVLKAFHERGHIAGIEEMFKMHEKYGKFCWMSDGVKKERYIKLGEYDKAMDFIEKDYKNRYNAYISTNMNYYEQLKDKTRYIEVLKKMNLPLGDKYNTPTNKRD